ncbi:hypothetical protein L1987_52610 [Smallanthus sonchifolius]|uniref:Uncharacterized protein n=1 Tax=Smallanthus sonchifolius TaxID=185202 RepID=A0ACB9EU20_9ASTR|nr:hypothetical protein L1987_52610 [Smallanthus sonchifolius]
MSSWYISYVFGEYSNQPHVSNSVFEPGVERGEEVVSVVRCDDGRVLPDLNQSGTHMVPEIPSDEGGEAEGVVLGCVADSVPSHRSLMVEFLSTFRFAPRPADQPNSDIDDPNEEPPPSEISFCLFGQRQNMSLHRFMVVSGIYWLPETV